MKLLQPTLQRALGGWTLREPTLDALEAGSAKSEKDPDISLVWFCIFYSYRHYVDFPVSIFFFVQTVTIDALVYSYVVIFSSFPYLFFFLPIGWLGLCSPCPL